MTSDMTLLREYARHHSEKAFAELVSRHDSLVYSVALRQVGNPALAEEVTQVTFIILARKAASLGPKTILAGWLCRTARYAAANALTIQYRRQHREHEAHMQSLLNEPVHDPWLEIAPLLDSALAQLGERDHDALVLRYFKNKTFQEIGAAFGATDPQAANAAKDWMGDKPTFRARSQREFASLEGFQILARKDLAGDKVELKYQFAFSNGPTSQETKIVVMVRINGVWKCAQTRAYEARWDEGSEPEPQS